MISDKKIVLINTSTAYLRLATAVIAGIFLMRAVFHYLSSEEYGFWVLLWSIFGYAILMDFGFGFAMEKFIPKYLVTNEREKINEIINTGFFCLLASSTMIVLATLVASNYLGMIFKFQGGQIKPLFKSAFILFGILTAIRFPFGLFQEVLVGSHRMYIRDFIMSALDFCILAAVSLTVYLNKGFLNLIIAFLGMSILGELICLVFSMKHIPGFKLSLRYFNKGMIKDLASFSLYTYIYSCASRFAGRVFQLIIGMVVSVTSVGIYQIASRLPVLITTFTTRIVPAVTPYASKLGEQADKEKMRRLIYSGTKFVMFLLIPSASSVFFFNRYILTLWLGNLNPQIFLLVPPLLITICLERLYDISIATFIMHEGQRKMARITVIRAIISIAAGIFFLVMFGLNGLVWSYLACSLFVYLFMIHSHIARLCGISFFDLFIKFLKPHLVTASWLLAFLFTYTRFFSVNDLPTFFTVNIAAFFFYTILFYLFALDKPEKAMIASAFAKIKKISNQVS